MATDSIPDATLTSLPPELRPNVEHLVTEDDTPVDNLFSEKQQRLLTEPLYTSWPGPGGDRPFVVMANVGLFFALEQPPLVPDMLLSLDVQCPADLWPKAHRSYFVWEYGKPPDAVVEIVSNRKGGEDSDKLAAYARIRIPYYAIFDADKLLSDQPLRVFRLEGMGYREMDDAAWLPEVGLRLQLWRGIYEGHDNTWLRWADKQGDLIPTGAERATQAIARAEHEKTRADQANARAEQETARADQASARAEMLAEQLRRLGVDPEA